MVNHAKLGIRQLSTTAKTLRSLVNPGSHECSFPIHGKEPVKATVEDAFKCVKSGKIVISLNFLLTK